MATEGIELLSKYVEDFDPEETVTGSYPTGDGSVPVYRHDSDGEGPVTVNVDGRVCRLWSYE
jgi:hypothetical protein